MEKISPYVWVGLNTTPDRITADLIIRRVQERYNVNLKEPSRKREVAEARHLACYLLKKWGGNLSHKEIAETVYGNRGRKSAHDMSIFACRKIENIREVDKEFNKEVLYLESLIV